MISNCNIIHYPNPYTNILYYTSYIYFFNAIYGLSNHIYDLASYTGLVWLTSINYWSNPTIKYNYYLDIITVRSGIIYHLFRALDATNYFYFYIIFITGLLFYIPARYFCSKEQYFISTIFHANMHIITGISLFYLYSNKIKPLSEPDLNNL